MYKTKLCLSLFSSFTFGMTEQLRLFKEAGFDGFFTQWNKEVKKCRELADELGMMYQSLHAPFGKIEKIWGNDDASADVTDELIRCVDCCGEYDIPIAVVHPYKGFTKKELSIDSGVENFRRVVDRAVEKNVVIAFENVEGEEYLAALMGAFADCENVGFCWDSGHELCYNGGKDMLALYGDRLVATHINDNLGISDFDGKIKFEDDLHLLPFDGITDWRDAAKRLSQCKPLDTLTFELTRQSKPRKHDNDKYMRMNAEEYVAECYARACKLAYMKQRATVDAKGV